MSATVELLQAGNQGSVTASPRRLVGMRKKTVFLTVAAVCVVAGLGAWALLRNSGGTQYRTATVSHHGDINVTISATGNPNAVVTVQVVDEFQRERNACRPNERHRTDRIGWLRAAVLGANDGTLSTASLVLGVAAAHPSHGNVMVAGVAGLVAGSMSMAAGEYVSVHSQADTEQADLKLERKELKTDIEGEHRELAAIYVARGLDSALAKRVAAQLMAHDALGAHARDELGISARLSARVRFRRRWHRPRASLSERSCLCWSPP